MKKLFILPVALVSLAACGSPKTTTSTVTSWSTSTATQSASPSQPKGTVTANQIIAKMKSCTSPEIKLVSKVPALTKDNASSAFRCISGKNEVIGIDYNSAAIAKTSYTSFLVDSKKESAPIHIDIRDSWVFVSDTTAQMSDVLSAYSAAK